MIIIIAADDIDTDLEDLAEKYDRAKNPGDREKIAEDTFALIGGWIKAMIKNIGRGLGEDDLDGFSHEAVIEALENSGMTRIKRGEGVWETLLQRFKGNHPVAKRILGLLLPDTRKMLETLYLKSTTADQLVREINNMLRRKDFFHPTAWNGVSLPSEAKILLDKGVENLSSTELTRFNALALSAACPEITIPKEAPPRSILGYISKFWLPAAKSRIAELGGAPPASEYLLEARNALKPIIDQLRRMEIAGTMSPELAHLRPAERVYSLYRQHQQQRYGPVVRWWNDQVRKLQPEHPFLVNSAAALRDAKNLFSQNSDKVNQQLWKEKSAPNFLPVSALQPFGYQIIQQVLDSSSGSVGPIQTETTSPAAPSSSDHNKAAQWLRDGRQSEAYHWLVQRLFGANEVEFEVGNFLANHLAPNRQAIDQFLNELPEEMASDIEEYGWAKLTLKIDRAVLSAVQDPKMQAEMERALDLGKEVVLAMVDGVRRAVFCRKTAFILDAAQAKLMKAA